MDADLNQRIIELEKWRARLDHSWLFGNNVLKQAFAVYGLLLLANFLVGFVLFICWFGVYILSLSGGY
jgi:hypothetical protein